MRLRTRLILSYLLVFGLGFYYIANWVLTDLETRYREAVEEVLVDEANILAVMVSGHFPLDSPDTTHLHEIFGEVYQRQLKAKIYELEKSTVDLRIYITDAEGIVIFDSHNQEEGRDYSQWRDVFLTLQGKYGARSTRTNPYDETTSVLHVAAPIWVDGEIAGVLTVAKPTTNINRFLITAKKKIWKAGLVAVLAIVLLNILILIWFTGPIEKLTRYANDIRDGKPVTLPRLDKSEIGEMGRAFEKMREALDNKKYIEQYIQTLTHELKSPISAIKGAAELLEGDVPATQRLRFLANIQSETIRIEQFISRLLQLAALENRRVLEKIQPVILISVIEEILSGLEPLIVKKGIQVSCSCENPVAIPGDPFLIKQAIQNLIMNAIDFSPARGQIEIQLIVGSADVDIVVRDEGPGLPDFARPKVFDKYFSLQRPDTGKKSTGLGLNFVMEVAKLHHGTIHLVNSDNGGLQAILSLPLQSEHRK